MLPPLNAYVVTQVRLKALALPGETWTYLFVLCLFPLVIPP
jgi:hypothetical protein